MRHIPRYMTRSLPRPRTLGGRILQTILQAPVQAFIWLFLSPRRGPVGNLSTPEIMEVYTQEAHRYDAKHHFTTRGQDTTWRREAAWCVLNRARALSQPIRVLDLCTGTGLTVMEMFALAHQWSAEMFIMGIDLNPAMVAVAKARRAPESIQFLTGDATKLPIADNSLDIITQVFGIGGVPEPSGVWSEALRTLKEGGQFYLVDMHRPIPELPGEMPVPGTWLRIPVFEAATYLKTTMPLALARLWGWRDPTLDFYQLSLAVHLQGNQWYGFRTVWFKQETERWWFGLPVMPTARILVEKVRLSESAARFRSARATQLSLEARCA